MPVVRRLLFVCALALALAALAAPASAATPGEIFQDYVLDREITGEYSVDDLKAALRTAREDALYGDFANAVDESLEASILGRTGGGGSADLSGATAEDAESPLPAPRSLDESGDPPWPFLALTILAGALVVTGAGSSIYRRARR